MQECRNASDWTVGKPACFVGKNDFSRIFAGFYAGHPVLSPRTPGSFDLLRTRGSLAPSQNEAAAIIAVLPKA